MTTVNNSAARAWLRALELTAPIARTPDRVISTVIEELAVQWGDAPSLLSERECLTYRGLAERVNQYARWALDAGIAKGEVVCLLIPVASNDMLYFDNAESEAFTRLDKELYDRIQVGSIRL
jgi:non-ribosomal peptide synthetase component F